MRTEIKFVGQPYVDEAVYAKLTPMDQSIRAALNKEMPKPIEIGRERVKLRWWEPDGKGGLRPKQ